MYSKILRQRKIPDIRMRPPYTYLTSSAFSSSVQDARALQIFKLIATGVANANTCSGTTM
jgi:hypothetical protein